MCILIGKSLALFRNSFLLLQSFWVKNAKIDFFKEKMVLSVVFIKLKCRWLQTDLSDLKHNKAIEFLLMVGFYYLEKNIAFFQNCLRFFKLISSSC